MDHAIPANAHDCAAVGRRLAACEEDFLYCGKFKGEACRVLDAMGISAEGKSAEQVLSEFQRSGFFLTHVLECPLETGQAEKSASEPLLEATSSGGCGAYSPIAETQARRFDF